MYYNKTKIKESILKFCLENYVHINSNNISIHNLIKLYREECELDYKLNIINISNNQINNILYEIFQKLISQKYFTIEINVFNYDYLKVDVSKVKKEVRRYKIENILN